MRFLLFLKHCLNTYTDERFIADAHAFGETRRTERLGDAERFGKILEKGASAPLRADSLTV